MTSTYCGKCRVTLPMGASCGCVRSETITTNNTGLPIMGACSACGKFLTGTTGCSCGGNAVMSGIVYAVPQPECTKCTEKNQHIEELMNRIKELEGRLEPCEVCGDIDCQDSDVAYYIRRWKEEEAKVKELEAMLNGLRYCGNCKHYSKSCKAPLFNYCVNYNKWEHRNEERLAGKHFQKMTSGCGSCKHQKADKSIINNCDYCVGDYSKWEEKE